MWGLKKRSESSMTPKAVGVLSGSGARYRSGDIRGRSVSRGWKHEVVSIGKALFEKEGGHGVRDSRQTVCEILEEWR
ncbi:hypothetical protein GDO78_021350 [Eleutherodactylus coqui]|uniref:Uncharacterized protein n=1 Tax=Eleutherodactylus coqui TaxID=57060 RepID=A0A8J6BCN4_ELECQ|nr:hypothetical protein GDO78_021350 [Eleutherodactylus coqui]